VLWWDQSVDPWRRQLLWMNVRRVAFWCMLLFDNDYATADVPARIGVAGMAFWLRPWITER